MMTLLPFTDCCLFLGVDPKTLRRWLQSAQLPFSLHLGDARLRCLTLSQLQHLADLHGRPLPNPLPLAPATTGSAPSPSVPLAPSASSASDLHNQLRHLQTQVAALQEQVTELALALLREREWRSQTRLSPQPASLPLQATDDLPPAQHTSAPLPVANEPSSPPSRSRSRALPLIQYGADGTYLAICPTQGILSLVPDSPEWFDWLSSLTAFTFQGAQGHFSTTRKVRQGQRIQAWNAYRSLRGRSCYLYLGQTRHLTVAHLEQMATTIYERLTSA